MNFNIRPMGKFNFFDQFNNMVSPRHCLSIEALIEYLVNTHIFANNDKMKFKVKQTSDGDCAHALGTCLGRVEASQLKRLSEGNKARQSLTIYGPCTLSNYPCSFCKIMECFLNILQFVKPPLLVCIVVE